MPREVMNKHVAKFLLLEFVSSRIWCSIMCVGDYKTTPSVMKSWEYLMYFH